VAGNLAFPLKVAGVPKAQRQEMVASVAAMLDLADRLNDRPGQLSGGQRQRVALGRAIIREPAIFLLDEPLSNLDADLRVRMRREIVRLQRKLGKTMVHVTHDQTEALTMADRIVLLHEGRIQQMGTPDELYNRPANLFVARFIGTPGINTLPGRIEGGRLIPFGMQMPRELGSDIAGVTIGLRPEAIRIGTDGDFDGEVLGSEYLGDQHVVSISFQNHTLLVSKVPEAIETGRGVRFSFDAKALRLFDNDSGRAL
jgi:sn-glycerol 3-phosphate transport system ATP-binding protein/multiple sugar transport system ATP-binding protein